MTDRKEKQGDLSIDTALVKHYDLTEAELDYTINYDIEYHMEVTQ